MLLSEHNGNIVNVLNSLAEAAPSSPSGSLNVPHSTPPQSGERVSSIVQNVASSTPTALPPHTMPSLFPRFDQLQMLPGFPQLRGFK